ncbi:MAG: hypothetical protein ABI686_06560 [Acidobacteriota bacterium]
MAHRHRPFYNLDKSVGPQQPNIVDDVMLVQFFLSEESKQHTIFQWDKPSEPLLVDGQKSDLLFRWILSFQVAIKAQGSPVSADGIVDPATGSSTQRSSHTHTTYTIVFLNNQFESMFPERFADLRKDPTVPGLLRAALQRSV